jgi:hypothetical protein
VDELEPSALVLEELRKMMDAQEEEAHSSQLSAQVQEINLQDALVGQELLELETLASMVRHFAHSAAQNNLLQYQAAKALMGLWD